MILKGTTTVILKLDQQQKVRNKPDNLSVCIQIKKSNEWLL